MMTPIREFRMSRRARRRIAAIAVLPLMLGLGSTAAMAAPPDLTAGAVVDSSKNYNLGATGARGWIYNNGGTLRTSESRQILITLVDAGSPADGVVEAADVILGASGTGAAPTAFAADARKSLALAIAEAEARNPGVLKLLRWRGGVTDTVELTLRTMGRYSATAPYDCPKSTKILSEGAQHLFDRAPSGRYSFGALALLASGDPAYQARVRTEARALVPTAAAMAAMMSDVRDTASTWERGHTLVFLAEYYLATSDAFVLPAIQAYAVNIARNQSLFGTVGHIYAEKNPDGSDNGPMGGVYGVVNSTGMPCFLGLLLAKQCGLTDSTLDPAIERTSRFFAYYSGKGAPPYGEHEPWVGHENNGKCGLAALAFSMQANRAAEGHFFAKMCTAATNEREAGHTGPFFSYLWSPLGANCGGEAAAAAYFNRASWHLDLARRWDGSFAYDNLGGGNNTEYYNFSMTAAALLTYALPLRQLRITGKNQDPARLLSATDVAEATAADTYTADGRSTNQLVVDLGNWSPVVRKKAAAKLATLTISTTLLNQLIALAADPNGNSRAGACQALGLIKDSRALPVLSTLLTDSDGYIRYLAAEALRTTTGAATVINDILAAAATTARPLVPFVEEDPLQFAHAKMAMLLFYSGNAYGPKGLLWKSLAGVDRNLLYPAIRAIAATPVGQARSTLSSAYKLLSYDDTLAVADAVVDSVLHRSPADKMFSGGVRQAGIEVLQKYGIAEGVPLSMIYMENDGRDSSKSAALGVLEAYAGGVTTVVPDPDVTGFLKAMLTGPQAANAQAVLDAIANDPNPAPLMPLKSIEAVAADSPALTLPAQATILRVSATDYALGDTVYTWRKVHGAGAISFSPNGTTASAATTVLFDGTPGLYLFEVTLSDSRGLTEVSQMVPVTLYNSAGVLPPNEPPVADPQQTTLSQGTPSSITLTGSDPEGYQLVYFVTTQPLHGSLSGNAPDLVYTPESLFTGTDDFTFQVMDSEGHRATAAVAITVTPAVPELAIYEPFNYPAGGLNGQGGTTDVGLAGSWSANSTSLVVAGSLTYGALPAGGGAVGELTYYSNRYGGARTVSASALAGNGLLTDGATLWFSLEMGYGRAADGTAANLTNARLAFALANSTFSTGNNDYWISNEGAQLGSGVGVTLGRINNVNGRVVASQFRDLASGDGTSGNILGSFSGATYGADQHGLIVGKIVWGADSDTIELYQPDEALNLGPVISTLAVAVDQSTFDTITWTRGDPVVMDEIRFGPSYASVLFGTTAIVADLSPPTPGPMQWAAAPAAISASAITMVAAVASDPSGVEYRFTNLTVTDGSHDSAWQDSRSFTDAGLAPLTNYTYQVWARDKSPARNETGGSAVLGATTEAGDISPPAPDPIQWATPPTATSEFSITMTAVNAVDPGGVEYYFTNLTVTDGSHNSGWQDSPSYVDTSLQPGTQYLYTVTARDKSPARNATAPSGALSATTTGTPATDYLTWTTKFPAADLEDPNADPDGDGLTNNEERLWGLDPTSPSAHKPLKVTSDLADGSFSYTRRVPALTGATYAVWTSTDLQTWTEDTGAAQTPGTAVAEIETVAVALSPALLDGQRLFVRVRATE